MWGLTGEGGDVELGAQRVHAGGQGCHLLSGLVQKGPPGLQLGGLPVPLSLLLRQLLDLRPELPPSGL